MAIELYGQFNHSTFICFVLDSIGDIWIMEDIHPRVTVEIRMSEAWMQTWDDVSEYGYQYHGSYAKASCKYYKFCTSLLGFIASG